MVREWDSRGTSGVEMSYFCESFSSLFALFLSKEAWMADVWNPKVKGVVGPLSSLGPLMIGSGNVWSFFLQKTQTIRVHGNVDDRVI